MKPAEVLTFRLCGKTCGVRSIGAAPVWSTPFQSPRLAARLYSWIRLSRYTHSVNSAGGPGSRPEASPDTLQAEDRRSTKRGAGVYPSIVGGRIVHHDRLGGFADCPKVYLTGRGNLRRPLAVATADSEPRTA